MGAAWNDVIASAFWRCTRQHRSLDVNEAVGIEIITHRNRHLMPQHQVSKHVFATQIDIAVLEADVFVGLLVVVKRRRFRLVENLELMCQHFDLAGTHVRVYGAVGARTNKALHFEHVLRTNTLGLRKNFGSIRVKNDL